MFTEPGLLKTLAEDGIERVDTRAPPAQRLSNLAYVKSHTVRVREIETGFFAVGPVLPSFYFLLCQTGGPVPW